MVVVMVMVMVMVSGETLLCISGGWISISIRKIVTAAEWKKKRRTTDDATRRERRQAHEFYALSSIARRSGSRRRRRGRVARLEKRVSKHWRLRLCAINIEILMGPAATVQPGQDVTANKKREL
ncbi:uncharacterized protein LOC119547574 [Drosophila subpulchrella]|uniref:uncharacterized protein LOC119547574 n=1 Tax=Drosophila subpulchrella TaxID=1486046 RepID=UPI0018A16BDE|nr:uncharacterized protein LOC119547574 [Drosophila subpulchrella]